MARVTMNRLQELVRLHRMGMGARQVARALRMSPNTERDYRQALEQAGALEGDPNELPSLSELQELIARYRPKKPVPQQVSTVARYEPLIEQMLQAGAQPQAIYDRLRVDDPVFCSSLSAIKRACARIRRNQGVSADQVVIPVPTEPGRQAQVDFGALGRRYDPIEGRMRQAWVFVMVLSHSRASFVRIVFDQKVKTWLRLHIEAFEYFGGVPAVLVPDNLKAAVVRAAFGVDAETALHRSYRELARHYGFIIDPTPPYSPQKKGKVESAVKYVKHNFAKARPGLDVQALQAELAVWHREVAQKRVHGTTGRTPLALFEAEERAALLALPTERYAPAVFKWAKVHRDCCVVFERSYYSVPWTLVAKQVLLRVDDKSVQVFFDDRRVATHSRIGIGQRSVYETHLPEHRGDYRHRSRTYWVERAQQMGPEVGRYIEEVFESDDVLSQLRTVQAMVKHLEGFPRSRAQGACRRARYYGSYRYGALKRILNNALDLTPLPDASPRAGVLCAPRFARDVRELIHPHDKESVP